MSSLVSFLARIWPPWRCSSSHKRMQDYTKKRIHALTAETVLKSTYMDDSIDSHVEADKIGVKLYRQFSSLWNHAGMQARK